MDTSNTKKASALAFLKSYNTGVLSTLSSDGSPRSRMVYYVCSEDFSIYFLTLISTRKVEDIRKHSQVAFSVSNDSVPQSIDIEGIANNVSDLPVSDEVVQAVFKQLQSNAKYGAPLTHFDAAVVKLFRITPIWIRWGDFTSGKHTSEVLSEI